MFLLPLDLDEMIKAFVRKYLRRIILPNLLDFAALYILMIIESFQAYSYFTI